MFLRAVIAIALVTLPGLAHADTDSTREALERLEEVLELRREDGLLDPRDVLPTILVSARPRYEASAGWFGVQTLTTLTQAFGAGSLRVCEACMNLRTRVQEGRLEQSSGPIGLDEIIQLDELYRGEAERARTAVWIDETRSGIAVRIVDLRSGGVVFAQNIDPNLREYRGSARTFKLTAELERRSRGESLTHAFFNVGAYPGQHIDAEWADQWGDTNSNLSGFVLSFIDPVLGVGASYHRVLSFQHITVGGQVLLSVPTALAQAFTDQDVEIIDPAVTGVFMLRWPFGNSNYAGLVTVSTNGAVGLGISLLNSSFIPVLP